MIDFERFWVQAADTELDEEDDADGMADEDRPGVGPEEIAEWEARHGVVLPEPLRTAFALRNGGLVRTAPLEILPLDQIVPVDEGFWDFTEIGESEAPDHSLLFVFGNETEVGGTYLLNFNARGPQGVPSVYLDFHGESTYHVNDTLGGLFADLLASSAVASVDWSEAEDLAALARESIDLSPIYDGRPASIDQVLAREGDALILLTRERTPEGEVLTRTTLPLPLEAASTEIGPRRPAPIATFGLHLQPEESDDIVEQQSKTDDDGRWKNSTGRGVPIYVTFESTDRQRLVSLRSQLLGPAGTARAEARQERQEELVATLDSLPPAERTAAMLQAALKMRDRIERKFAPAAGDLTGLSGELAKAAEAMRVKMEQMVRQAQEKIAANPPDPKTVQQIERLLDDFEQE
ncbi:MAG TPA: SMI1/KNR4 family protein [Pirellulales bacterium]|nr:SMI1/KNR4 family protein [Pirellulales bacterium]